VSKVSVVNFQSLDGVVQSVLAADEDRDGGFEHGGWVPPYVDEVVAGFMGRHTTAAGALTLTDTTTAASGVIIHSYTATSPVAQPDGKEAEQPGEE
jgi:hypothetical protein